MTLYQNLLFTGIILSAILSVIFLLRKKSNKGNLYFSAYLAVMSAFLLLSIASTRRIDISASTVVFYSNLTFLLLLLSGPLLLLYFSSSTGVANGKRNLLYLLPPGLMAIYTSAQFICSLFVPVESPDDYLPLSLVLFAVSYGYMLFCFFRTALLLQTYSRNLKNYYSDLHRKKLLWFRALIYFVILISLVDLASRLVEYMKPGFQSDYQVIDVIETVFIITISFFALLQPEIIRPGRLKPGRAEEKYGNSSLTDREVKTYLNRLETYMEQQKPYLHDLSLPELAESTGMNVHTLSQVINRGRDDNFHSYINKYRVDEVISLMKSGENAHRSILDLSTEAGFNSKSVFYTFFKLRTGETPSAYRNKLK